MWNKPELLGGVRVDGTGLANDFIRRFGSTWRKTPIQGIFCLLSDGVQITMVESSTYGMDFAMYRYDTAAEFKDAFERKAHCGNAEYFQLNNTGVNYKYPYLRIIEFLKSRGLW